MAADIVTFVTTGGHHIGLGHLRRCYNLVTALENIGLRSYFMLIDSDHLVDRWMKRQRLLYRRIEGDDLINLPDICRSLGSETIVIDSYDIDSQVILRLLQNYFRVLVIDDIIDRNIPATWLTNSSLLPEDASRYAGHTSAILLLGPEYAILNERFAIKQNRDYSQPVKNILITIGGADKSNYTPEIIRLIHRVSGPLKIQVVIGPLSSNYEECLQVTESSHHQIELIQSTNNMRELIRQSDLAICSAGQTLFEMAASGCPCVALQVANNQKGNLDLFRNLKFGALISPWEPTLFLKLIKKTIEDVTFRDLIAQHGPVAVDGKGASRIASVLSKR